MNESELKNFYGFLQNQGADHTSDYAQRGRRFERLSDNALTLQWVAGFRAVATDWADPEARKRVTDLSAEYTLRGIEPPYHLVKRELDTFTEAAVSLVKQIQESDPERFAEMARVFAAQFEDYKSKRTS